MPGWGPGLGVAISTSFCHRKSQKRGVHRFLPQLPARPPNPFFPDSIPLLSPFIAPNIRALGPILSQLATSPLRSGMEQWLDLLKGEGKVEGEGVC